MGDGDTYRLEDDGEYLAHLAALGIDFDSGRRAQLLQSALDTAGAFWDKETYEIKTGFFDSHHLTERMVQFLSALIRTRDLELLTPDFVRSTFREDATSAIVERFSTLASVDEGKPVTDELLDNRPDLVIRPRNGGRRTAIFFASSVVPFQEAELLKAEIERKGQQEVIGVVALIEDPEKIAGTITLRRFQRAQNRGLVMPIFRGDEPAALTMIAKLAGIGAAAAE